MRTTETILNWTSASDSLRNQPEGSNQYRRELLRCLRADHNDLFSTIFGLSGRGIWTTLYQWELPKR